MMKAEAIIEKLTDEEIIQEYRAVEARLAEIEPIVEGTRDELYAIGAEIEALRDYKATLKATLLVRSEGE